MVYTSFAFSWFHGQFAEMPGLTLRIDEAHDVVLEEECSDHHSGCNWSGFNVIVSRWFSSGPRGICYQNELGNEAIRRQMRSHSALADSGESMVDGARAGCASRSIHTPGSKEVGGR